MSLTSIRVVAVMAMSAAFGMAQDTARQLAAGRDLRAAGRYGEAKQVFTTLLRDSEPRGASLQATVLDDLAITEQNLGNLATAEKLLTRALSLLKTSGAAPEHEIARIEGHLGEVYLEEGRPRDAEPLFRHLLQVRQSELPPDPENVAVALADLAMAREHQGKLVEAEKLLRQAVAILEARFGTEHPLVAGALLPLAATMTREGRYPEALALTKRTWQILSRDPRVAEPDLLNTLSSLGWLYSMTGNSQDARSYAQQAVTRAETIYGPDHQRLGRYLANYAFVLKRTGRKDEAKAVEKRAKAVLTRSRQANPPAHTVNVSALR